MENNSNYLGSVNQKKRLVKVLTIFAGIVILMLVLNFFNSRYHFLGYWSQKWLSPYF
jgi:hypothetical protein